MSKYSIPVWRMIESSFEKKDPRKFVTIMEIVKRVHALHPKENVNKMTIRLQTIFHCVNHPGRKNDVSRRWERNPLFFSDGENKFRLLTEDEKKKIHKNSLDSMFI